MSGLETLTERVARAEGRVEEHSRAMEDIAGRFTNLEGRLDRFGADVQTRFERVEARFERLESRFDRFESGVQSRFEGVSNHFDRVESRLERLDAKIDGARDELDSKLTRQFTWTVGLIGGSALGLAYEILRVAAAR